MFDDNNPFSTFFDTTTNQQTIQNPSSTFNQPSVPFPPSPQTRAAQRIRNSVKKFTPQEDTQLRTAVAQCTDANGTIDWEAVAALIPNRTKKQLKERWKNCLNPTPVEKSKTRPWTIEDQQRLLKLREEGNSLKDIALKLDRSYGSVRQEIRFLTIPGLKQYKQQRDKQYYQEHREEIRENQNQYYQKNKEEISQKRKEKKFFSTFNDTSTTISYNSNQQQQNQAQQQNIVLTQNSANIDLAINDPFLLSFFRPPEISD